MYQSPYCNRLIGWGSFANDKNEITEQEGEELVERDVKAYTGVCQTLLRANLNQNEQIALICFAIVVGLNNLLKSKLF